MNAATFEAIKLHEHLKLIPPVEGDTYKRLKEDIKASNRLLVPIPRYKGVVLDGRARLKICQELGIEPSYEDIELPKGQTPTEIVLGLNIARRHLDTNQRALLATQFATLKAGDNQHTSGAATCGLEKLAEQFAVSKASITRAKQIVADGIPELVEKVRQGKMDLSTGREVAKAPREVQEYVRDQVAFEKDSAEILRQLELGRLEYRRMQGVQQERDKAANDPVIPKEDIGMPDFRNYEVIYADPPWRYMGKKETPYETMPLEDIMAMPVRNAPENAVLFLWSPASVFPDALKVVEAWGFEYVTNAIWNRGGACQGYYFRIGHEHLIIAKKGKPPLVRENARPKHSIFAEKKREHSKKPERAYRYIEKMYPQLHKLELFARGEARDGWSIWGDQAKDGCGVPAVENTTSLNKAA